MSENQVIKVLIVDDHLMVRDGLRVFLSTFDDIVVVGEAAGGAMAISLCEELNPDVVLMDLLMPDMDGFEATRRIRLIDASIRVIAVTSFSDKEMIGRAFQAGAISYLLKEVNSEKLAAAIREELILGAVGSRGARAGIRAALLAMGKVEGYDFTFVA